MNAQTLVERSLQSVWHPCSQMKHHETFPLIPIARGEGIYLYDTDGKRYIDGVSSWWVNLFGHNHPVINEAIESQLHRFAHVMLAGFTHEPVVELSERLGKLTGLGHAFYGSDGASATEIALKMSFHYWRNTLSTSSAQKTRFLCLKNSYHGETLGALGVTDVALFKDTYAPLLQSATLMPSPDARLAEPGESAEEYAARCVAEVEAYLAIHHHEIAAFILEPLIQCATGMAMYSATYLTQLRAVCDRFNVHLIADEIAVGFGRTGTLFACEQAGILPDFICLSKGITGGYLPLSVTLTTEAIYQAFYDDRTARGFLHSHSYTGNALACSAALATLNLFEEQNVIVRNQARAHTFNTLLRPIQEHPRVQDFRHLGMVWAFEVDTSRSDFARACYAEALAQGLLIRPIGNTLYLMPPYVLSEEDMSNIVRILLHLLATL